MRQPRGRHALGARRGQRHGRRDGRARRRPRRHREPRARAPAAPSASTVPSADPPPGGERPVRILICEDSVLLREGLVRLLEDAGHERGRRPPRRRRASPKPWRRSRPSSASSTCGSRRPTPTRASARRCACGRSIPTCAVLVLSQYVEERYASELIAGAGGATRLPAEGPRRRRRASSSDRSSAIAAGATVFDPEVVAQLLGRRARDERMQRLTDRERTVLALIAEGKSNQAIAEALFVSRRQRREAHHRRLPEARPRAGRVRQPTRARRPRAHLEHGGGQPQTGDPR